MSFVAVLLALVMITITVTMVQAICNDYQCAAEPQKSCDSDSVTQNGCVWITAFDCTSSSPCTQAIAGCCRNCGRFSDSFEPRFNQNGKNCEQLTGGRCEYCWNGECELAGRCPAKVCSFC